MENNNNNNHHSGFTNWSETPEQNNNTPHPAQYPGYPPMPRRRRKAWVVILVVLLIFAISAGGNLAVRVFNRVTSSTLANGANIQDGGITFNQTGVALDIRLARSSVVVKTHNSSYFQIDFAPPARGNFVRPVYAFSLNGMRLDIVEELSTGLFNFNTSNQRGVLTILVPQNIDGAFADIVISTTSGRIDIQGDSDNRLANGAVISATSGRVQAENLTAGSIDVRATSGALGVNRLIATDGDITVRTTSGGITVDNLDVNGNIHVNATSGRIRAGELAANGHISIESTSGSLALDIFTANSVNLSATSGAISINNGNTTAGDFSARATSGGIRVNGLDVNGNLNMNATSARLTADNVTVSGNLSMETTSGGVTLENSIINGRINARATSGSINITNVTDESRMELSTSSGSINVNGQRWGR